LVQEGPEQTPKEREAAAAISATVAAASERQQRRAIPVQGEFFMPGDEAGAGADATLTLQVPLHLLLYTRISCAASCNTS
jgi:hypothetical protein